ncbi:hypothetical protein [Nonomuraea sp. CA-141351]|uniref:hypothetical protein n=1 Tax=Nonomuraea sp. CA-141351 TaxID=3239996 RepID=UPI003D900D26
MADEKSRSRRRISIDGAGIERRRTAIQTLIDQAPQPRTEPVAAPDPAVGASPDSAESPGSPVQTG